MLLNLKSIKINFVESNLQFPNFHVASQTYNSYNISVFHPCFPSRNMSMEQFVPLNTSFYIPINEQFPFQQQLQPPCYFISLPLPPIIPGYGTTTGIRNLNVK